MKQGYKCSHCYGAGHTHRTCPELIDGTMVGMSRHVRHQLRKNERGLCRRCQRPLSGRSRVFCDEHLAVHNRQTAARARQSRAAGKSRPGLAWNQRFAY